MLPFDNKSELQVVIDMPEGSTLEETAGIARSLADTVRTLPEVTDVQIYVGTSAPFNFNGLVRHYFLRSGPLVADLQINLLPKHHRDRASHPFAKELRDLLAPIVEGTEANVKVTEVPPGPPVLSTMVAEIYGPDLEHRLELAQKVRDIFDTTPGIVDVDWWVENPGPQVEFEVDREKTVRAGTTPEAVVRTLRVALEGAEVGLLRDETARESVPLVLRLDRSQRSSIDGLLGISVHGSEGRMVPLGELVKVRPTSRERFIYHKNLQPLTYVIGEVAGNEESPIYGILDMQDRVEALQDPSTGEPLEILCSSMPDDTTGYAMKWDGEWQHHLRGVSRPGHRFRGRAGAHLRAHRGLVRVLHDAAGHDVGDPADADRHPAGPLLFGAFFTATSMIGMIALAGIIVRNGILLIDFWRPAPRPGSRWSTPSSRRVRYGSGLSRSRRVRWSSGPSSSSSIPSSRASRRPHLGGCRLDRPDPDRHTAAVLHVFEDGGPGECRTPGPIAPASQGDES